MKTLPSHASDECTVVLSAYRYPKQATASRFHIVESRASINRTYRFVSALLRRLRGRATPHFAVGRNAFRLCRCRSTLIYAYAIDHAVYGQTGCISLRPHPTIARYSSRRESRAPALSAACSNQFRKSSLVFCSCSCRLQMRHARHLHCDGVSTLQSAL